MAETCALDVADRGPHTLDEIAGHLGLTRERVRQIEESAMRKLNQRHWVDVETACWWLAMPPAQFRQLAKRRRWRVANIFGRHCYRVEDVAKLDEPRTRLLVDLAAAAAARNAPRYDDEED